MLGAPKRFLIRSSQRETGRPGNFSILTPDPQVWAETHNRVYVESCSIPVTWYTVTEMARTVFVSVDAVESSVDLPIGNYSATELAATLASVLSAETGLVITCVLNRRTGKYTFTSPTPPAVSLRIPSVRLARTIGVDVNTANLLLGGSFICPKTCVLNNAPAIEIKCNFVADGVLQDIYATGPRFDYLNWVNQDPMSSCHVLEESLVNHPTLNFQMVDLLLQDEIDLNGQEWAMTLVTYRVDASMYQLVLFARSWAHANMRHAEAKLEEIRTQTQLDVDPDDGPDEEGPDEFTADR